MQTPVVEISASLTTESEAENSDDDDQVILPDDTLAILQQFLKEKADREKFEEAAATTAAPNPTKPAFNAFEENWVSTTWLSSRLSSSDTSSSTATESILVQQSNKGVTCSGQLSMCPASFRCTRANWSALVSVTL